MSKYQCFKEWIKTKAPTSLASFDSVVRQDSSVVQMTADFVDGVLTTKAASDAIIAIAYADHCTQSLQAEIEKLKAENERLKAAQEWRSMESAPSTGYFKAWHGIWACEITVCFVEDGTRLWLTEKTKTTQWPIGAFTRWAPLPNPREKNK